MCGGFARTHHSGVALRAIGMQMVLAATAMAALRLRPYRALRGNVIGEFAAIVAAHAASFPIAAELS